MESRPPGGPAGSRGRIHDLEMRIVSLLAERDAASKEAAAARASVAPLQGELDELRRKADEERAALRKEVEEARAESRKALDEARAEVERVQRKAAEDRASLLVLIEEAGRNAREASRKELEEARLAAERLKVELEAARNPAATPVKVEATSPPAPEAEPAPAAPSIFDDQYESLAEAPPPVAADLPPEVREAAADPANLFGPAAADGRPSHVLLEVLHRDGLGAVHRAYDRTAGRAFALRILAGPSGEQNIAALEAELQKLIGLPHPNLLPVRFTGRHGGRLTLATDLVPATTLGKSGIRDVPRICAILRNVADAVHYAHEEGILHGDLNPETILIHKEEADHALVADFGLAWRLEAAEAGLMIRNPAFLPPEKGGPTVASDVYGLGACFYAALAGRPPFEGKDVRQIRGKVLMEEPPPLERTLPGLPGTVSLIIRRAMAKEAGIRFATAREMADALNRFLEGSVTRVMKAPSIGAPAP